MKIKAISKGHSELQKACSQLHMAVLDIFHPVTSFSKEESKRSCNSTKTLN